MNHKTFFTIQNCFLSRDKILRTWDLLEDIQRHSQDYLPIFCGKVQIYQEWGHMFVQSLVVPKHILLLKVSKSMLSHIRNPPKSTLALHVKGPLLHQLFLGITCFPTWMMQRDHSNVIYVKKGLQPKVTSPSTKQEPIMQIESFNVRFVTKSL